LSFILVPFLCIFLVLHLVDVAVAVAAAAAAAVVVVVVVVVSNTFASGTLYSTKQFEDVSR